MSRRKSAWASRPKTPHAGTRSPSRTRAMPQASWASTASSALADLSAAAADGFQPPDGTPVHLHNPTDSTFSVLIAKAGAAAVGGVCPRLASLRQWLTRAAKRCSRGYAGGARRLLRLPAIPPLPCCQRWASTMTLTAGLGGHVRGRSVQDPLGRWMTVPSTMWRHDAGPVATFMSLACPALRRSTRLNAAAVKISRGSDGCRRQDVLDRAIRIRWRHRSRTTAPTVSSGGPGR